MDPRVLFGTEPATPGPATGSRVSKTVAKTPAAVRLRYLTKQLASHRERITELETSNRELQAALDSASGSSEAVAALDARTAVLEAQLVMSRADASDWRARAEAAEDEVTRLRVERGRKAKGTERLNGMTSPLTPSAEYAALLAATRASSDAEAVLFGSPEGGAPSFEDAGDDGSWASVVVHPLVVEAASLCAANDAAGLRALLMQATDARPMADGRIAAVQRGPAGAMRVHPDSVCDASSKATLFHVACRAGSKACVRALLRHGCNVLTIDANGRTAVDEAIDAGRTSLAEYLQRKGAIKAEAGERAVAALARPSRSATHTPSGASAAPGRRHRHGRSALASPLSPAQVNRVASSARRRKSLARHTVSAAALGIGSPAL